jgi:hypothetical protein
MVAILVLLTIIGFIAIELITTQLKRHREARKENVLIFEQPLVTMTDGGEPIDEKKK